ncbi:MAG: TatD family deoxyribonuclease [Chitinophagia bacterium]|jgi:TatD DNase family protein|nr:TatD family deoxyribonuclease [Chitinophagia bacterium]
MFIDTHAHLYDEQFIQDIQSVIFKSQEQGVEKIFMPNCDLSTLQPMLAIANEYPRNCFPMLGLHPCYVKEDVEEVLEVMQKHLSGNISFSAIGEIGLDYYWDKTFVEQQKRAFELQIDWALQSELSIVVHSRESTQDCIDIIAKKQQGDLRGIFHCFSGTLNEAKQLIDLGFYLGIGGVLTFKNSDLKSIVKDIDLKHLVLETDAPYLAPVPQRGKRNEPSYIPLIASIMAEIKQVTIDEIAHQTSINANQIFKNHN